MTVTFELPNGSMEIVLDTFLKDAKVGQIRKAIKLMPDQQKQETAAWLKEQRDMLAQKALNRFMLHREYESRIPELKRQAEQLKHHPEEKEQLRETRMRLSHCRRLSIQYRRKSEEMLKLKKRYEDIIQKFGVCK